MSFLTCFDSSSNSSGNLCLIDYAFRLKIIISFRWDDTYHTFKLVSAHSIKDRHYVSEDNLAADTFGTASAESTSLNHANNDPAHNDGVDLWKQCFDTLKQRSCEYSSGVCFVEERRVWGYVTQVSFNFR